MPFFNHLIKYGYLFLLYPIFILSYVVSQKTDVSFTPERIIFLHLLLYFIAYFIANKKICSVYVRFIYLTTLFFTFCEVAYVSIYKERITPSTTFVLIETNASETVEYLKEYFNTEIFLWLLILLIPSIFILIIVNKTIHQFTLKNTFKAIFNDLKTLFLFLEKIWKKTQSSISKKIIFGIFILIIGTVAYVSANHHKYHAVFKLISGYEKYQTEIIKYKNFLSNSNKSKQLKTVKPQKNNLNETLIIVIGESTTKHHLGIYGYYRNTTPNLEKLKNELTIFNEVISPHTHTILSLEKALTFGTTNNVEAKENGSIVQLVKAAGYKTYWISNQIPIGINETMVSIIAKSADYKYFTNLGGEKELFSLDERVLPILTNALKKNEQKKVIFIHLIGTHTQYVNRYPKNFNQFKDTPITLFGTQQAFDAINHYDNAILYNDFILNEIINLLKTNASTDEKQQLIYFSDHGEDVYQTVDFNGHSESIGSYPMFEIPFIFWSNEKTDVEKYANFKDRKYMVDQMIYSVADLLNISFDGMQPENSIFNSNFKEQKRIVKQNLDFDVNVKPISK